MEFNINKGLFTDAIRKVNKAISNRAVIPVLSGIYIIANDEGLMITGSDSNLSIRTFIGNDNNDGAEILAEGSIVLPAKELMSIARSMPEKNINIKVEDNLKSVISSGKSKFTLNGVNGDQYPKLPSGEGDGFTVDGDALSDFIQKTSYAVSNMETRPVLTGVNLFFEGDEIGMVATDSHRLSKFVGMKYEGTPLSKSVTIPERALKELPALLKDAKKVTIKKHNNLFFIHTDKVIFFSRLLEDNYPETNRLIPSDNTTSLTVNRLDFLSAMERAAILTEGNSGTVTFKISGESKGIFDTIELSHQNNEVGQSKEDIIVNKIEGEEITLSFNPVFMIDALKRVDDNEVVIEFNGAMRPFLIKPMDRSVDFTQLILPVRTY